MSRHPFGPRAVTRSLGHLSRSRRLGNSPELSARQYSVLPNNKSAALTSSTTASSTFWRSVLMQLLTGERVSGVRGGAWTSSGLLHAAAVRSEPWHPAHRCNLPLLPLLVKLLDSRDPFQDDELQLLRRRTDHPLLLQRTLSEDPSSREGGCLDTLNGDGDEGRSNIGEGIQTHLHRLASEPPSTWLDASERIFRLCKDNKSQSSASVYDDILFRISSNPSLSDPSMIPQCFGEVLRIVEHCFVPHALLTSTDQSAMRCVVSPRWMRKLRKQCCESQSYGAIMQFASFYESMIAIEEKRLGKTELTCDGELLAFHSSIAGRRDSGLSRDMIAQETISQLTFSLPRLLSLSTVGTRGGNEEEATEIKLRALRNSFNSIAFAMNDGNEATRLCEAIVKNILPSLVHHGSTPSNHGVNDNKSLDAEMVTLLFEVAFDALKGKWEALRCTCSPALANFVKVQVAVLNYLELQQTVTETGLLVSHGEVALCVENTDAELLRATPSTTQRLIDTTAMLLCSMGRLVSTPRIFDSFAQSFVDILETVLSPIRLHARHVCSLVHSVSQAAPHGSIWKQWVKSPMWVCGCGQNNFFVSNACVSCTLTASTTTSGNRRGEMSCPHCRTTYSAHLAACIKCAMPQPRLRALDQMSVWICHKCETQNSNNSAACVACHSLNPRRRIQCSHCKFECLSSETRCNQCGESLFAVHANLERQRAAQAAERLWICSTCNSLLPVARPSSETLPCHHCAARGTLAPFVEKSNVTTHFFQWTCGCGARNHPSNIQCHSCKCTFTCASCKAPVKIAQPHSSLAAFVPVASLKGGFKAISCGSCRSLHPRDKALVQERRATLCQECESINSLDSDTCHKCDTTVRENRSCRATAVVDLPWTCHCCGQVNFLEDDKQSDGFASCTSCLVDRPPGVLFDQYLPWNCSHCGGSGNVGFHCPHCFNLHPAVPPSEAEVWECPGCSATNFSWSKSCSKCQVARSEQSLTYQYQPWRCGRCNTHNSPLATDKCLKCHMRRRGGALSQGTVGRQGRSNEERLKAVEELLLSAANESAAKDSGDSHDDQTITSLLMSSSSLSEGDNMLGSSSSSIDAVLNDLMMR